MLLDRDGVIAQVNESWRRFARSNGWDPPRGGIGLDYLAVCAAAVAQSPDAEAAGEGIRRVLRGQDPLFELEYPCESPDAARWFRLLVTPWIVNGVQGAVVMHIDVTREALVRQKAQRLSRLYLAASGISEAIVRVFETRELLESACRILVEQGGVLLAWVGWAAPGDDAPRVAAKWGDDHGFLEAIRTAAASGRAEDSGPEISALRTGCTAWSADLGTTPSGYGGRAERLGIRSCAAIPLGREQQASGIVAVYSADPGHFEAEERALLEVVVENLSFAIAARDSESRRREGERALRESEARMSEAERIAQMGSWELTIPGNRLTWSKEVYRIFGVDPLAFAGTFEALLALVHPEDRDLVVRGHEVARGGERPLDLEHRIVRADGEIRHVRERAVLLQQSRLVGTVQDVTDVKRLERQFLRAERLETIATLASGIGHDLNNTLAPILLSLELLKGGELSAQQMAQTLAAIEASALRGADVVRQLLSFARGVEGRRVEVQVKHLLRDVEKIAKDTFPKSIQVRVMLPTGLWPVVGDGTQLHQAVLSLCLNARDAMPVGGTLTLAAENVVLDEQYAVLDREGAPGPHLCVRVEDTGHGIPAAIVERIFDPFFTTKDPGGGTGLGLTTALAVVRGHGGFIRVYSEPGVGTTFRVYLPAESAPREAQEHEREPAPPRGHGECVLVVEDEASVRDVTKRTLEGFGYRVLLASDGAEALVVFTQHRAEVAVVLTDVMMPLMDGTALLRALRRIEPGLRIVVMSGLGADRQLANATDGAVKYFLDKPFTAGELLTTLRTALDSDR